MIWYVLCIFSVFIASGAQMLLKQGARQQYPNFIRQYLNFWVISGYAIMFLSLVLNIHAMSKGVLVKELSIIEALSYLFVPTLSYIFFKERLTVLKFVAVLVIMTGVVVFFV